MKKKTMIVVVAVLCTSALLGQAINQKKRELVKSLEIEAPAEKLQNDPVLEDTDSPILILKLDHLTITAGIEINYPAMIDTAYDKIDGDLIDQVTYTRIDTSMPGEYTILYRVSDHAGNQTTAHFSVTVMEDYGLS